MWPSISALALCLLFCLDCSDSSRQPSQPSDTEDGGRPGLRPVPVPLTEDSVVQFLHYVASSTKADEEYVASEIDRAKSNAVIVQRILDELARGWPATKPFPSDINYQLVIFAVVKHLQTDAAADLLHEMVWRPQAGPKGSDPETGLEVAEAGAVEAFACIPSERVATWVNEIIASHPDPGVRAMAAGQRAQQKCRFWEDATPVQL
jgi:hypothetical protein